MPSPLDNIKQGILKNNMSLVKKGYTALTGEKISVLEEPAKPPRRTRTVKNESRPKTSTKRTIAKKPVKETKTVSDPYDTENFRTAERELPEGTSGVQAKLEDVRLGRKKNKFTDNLREFKEERQLSKAPKSKSATKRPPVRYINTVCGTCRATDKVLETEIIPEATYYCRECLKQKFYGR